LATLRYDGEKLAELFRKQKICTMVEMKRVLGTQVDLTVSRKLKALDYRTSYSHRGAYYTLDSLARWDRQGLWVYAPAHFSRQGTLVETVEHFVKTAEGGCTAAELEVMLGVGVKEPLLNLVREGRLDRDESGAAYVYHAPTSGQAQAQKEYRRTMEERALFPSSGSGRAMAVEEIQAAVVLFWSLLDEQQRRLYAGLESMKLGPGGDRRLSELLGADVQTIARGRRELLTGDVETSRVRRAGGGRRAVEKKRLT
jgi:hypothetical protein